MRSGEGSAGGVLAFGGRERETSGRGGRDGAGNSRTESGSSREAGGSITTSGPGGTGSLMGRFRLAFVNGAPSANISYQHPISEYSLMGFVH